MHTNDTDNDFFYYPIFCTSIVATITWVLRFYMSVVDSFNLLEFGVDYIYLRWPGYLGLVVVILFIVKIVGTYTAFPYINISFLIYIRPQEFLPLRNILSFLVCRSIFNRLIFLFHYSILSSFCFLLGSRLLGLNIFVLWEFFRHLTCKKRV